MKNYPILLETFTYYVQLVRIIAANRGHTSARLLETMDRERSQVHDQLLKQAGVGRDDSEFALWLAIKTEEHL